MNLNEVKDRVAAALVESIFRRARYEILPFRREGGAPRGVREDFAPDFLVRVPADAGARQLQVGVRYHPQIEQFLAVEAQRGPRSVLQLARRQWPDLYLVLATERPEPGRSCFQAASLSAWTPGGAWRPLDLSAVPELGIFAHNVADHEALIRRIFALLTAA
jgi:hypothetical protein